MGHHIDFAVVDQLAVDLVTGGVRSAGVDLAALQLPGVWVKFQTVTLDFLDGYTIGTTLYLIAADKDPRRTADDLAALFNEVTDVVEPSTGAAITAVELAMPDGTTLPALAFPFDLYAT